MISPYVGIHSDKWPEKTEELIAGYPLKMSELVEVVLASWKGVFASKIGSGGFQIGEHIFPKPQIIAFFLHELIPLELARRYPGVWRGEETAADKDIVYVPNAAFSMEIKTSSHPTQIFGNRSYAQQGAAGKKSKSGFYLAVNFEKSVRDADAARLRRIRFGWLDHTDWQGQTAATGQQARLSTEVERGKLRLLFEDR
jgi:hypothetical protein